jgi:hypothetical protein
VCAWCICVHDYVCYVCVHGAYVPMCTCVYGVTVYMCMVCVCVLVDWIVLSRVYNRERESILLHYDIVLQSFPGVDHDLCNNIDEFEVYIISSLWAY